MSKKIVDSFTVGGTKAGPSMPGTALQRMLGTRIEIDMFRQCLNVPASTGIVTAFKGDRVIIYDDDSLEVENGNG